jgi:hypothetical protein
MSFDTKKLVRESDWMRIFKFENEETYIYESKFLVDDLRVSPLAIKKQWPGLSPSEKQEFSTAFGSQPPRDNDDQNILQFLMEVGPEEVWRNIAVLLPFHTRPDVALAFLIDKVQHGSSSRADYYQAIELLRGMEAVPILRRHFDEYRSLLFPKVEGDNVDLWINYLQCGKTLFNLTQDLTYLSELKRAQRSASLELQAHALRIVHEAEKVKR